METFDYSTFCNLGILNDERGGDSCGFFIDGHTEYGFGKEDSFFTYFFQKSEFLQTLEKSSVALGHCRKASIGSINKESAQPVVIANKKGKPEFVLLHNGTISNYKELAKKYIPEENIASLTDSQVMALIFYHTGYDALSEYDGSAVFVVADYRKKSNGLYLYKGASKKNFWDKDISEERPLFYCLENERLTFSSLRFGLKANRRGIPIYSLETNKLFKFNGSELVLVKNIKREQKKYDLYKSLYITQNLQNNLYHADGGLMTGVYCITKFGMINSFSEDSKPFYFFYGILMRNKKCFNFLMKKKEKSQSYADFYLKNKYLVHFLSIDQLYVQDGIWCKVVSPSKSEPYTGCLGMLGSYSIMHIVDGKKISTSWGVSNTDVFDTYGQDKFNPKTLKNVLCN